MRSIWCSLLVLTGLLLGLRAAPDALACDRNGWVIALDPGHSPDHPGAVSARGVQENQFNRSLAEAIQHVLRAAGFGKVYVTDEDGAPKSLLERAQHANARLASVLLSIHHDSVQPQYLSSWTYQGKHQSYSDVFSGYSLFVSTKNPNADGSRRMAEFLGDEFNHIGITPSLHHTENIPGERRELLDPRRGIYRFDDLLILKNTHMAAVLIEAGLIVNRRDELLLGNPLYQHSVAVAVETAVDRYCTAVHSGTH